MWVLVLIPSTADVALSQDTRSMEIYTNLRLGRAKYCDTMQRPICNSMGSMSWSLSLIYSQSLHWPLCVCVCVRQLLLLSAGNMADRASSFPLQVLEQEEVSAELHPGA